MRQNGTKRKYYYLLALGLLFTFFESALSQTFDVFWVSTNYPRISALFQLKDSAGKILRDAEIPDIYVRYNKLEKKCEISCPEPIKGKISIVFALDVSKTMETFIPKLMCDRIFYEKALIRSALKSLPSDSTKWEAAIMLFNHKSYTLQNFTNSKTILLDALNSDSIYARGGCDYNEAFSSARSLYWGSKFKPIVLMISDGVHNESEDYPAKYKNILADEIIKQASASFYSYIPATIYSIFIDRPTQTEIEQITQSTGGKSIATDISTYLSGAYLLSSFFEEAFNSVLESPTEYLKHCELSWTANCEWTGGIHEIIIPEMKNLGATYMFGDYRPQIYTNPKTIRFITDSASTQTAKITINAWGASSNINSIKFKTPEIRISDWGGSPPPFKLDSNRIITLEMNIKNADFDTAIAEIENDACKSDTLRVIRAYKEFILDLPVFTLVCNGIATQIGKIDIASGGKPPYQFRWTPKTGLSSDTVPNPIITATQETKYHLTVYDSRNSVISKDIYVFVNDVPEPKINYLNGRVIERDTAKYKATVSNNQSYKWSITNGSLLTPDTSDSAIVVWKQSGAATLVLKQTDNKSGCFAFDTMNVTVGISDIQDQEVYQNECQTLKIRNLSSNPLNGMIDLYISSFSDNSIRIELINQLGIPLRNQVLEMPGIEIFQQISTKDLSTGIYFLIIRTASCNLIRKVIIAD